MIDDIKTKIQLHQWRLEAALQEIENWETLDSTIFDDFEKIKVIDTFIYRFIKLQDLVGEKLFKVFLDEIGEYKDTMSLVDILDKLEKFEIIENTTDWITYRKLRNQLTHEYPDSENEVIEGIKIAINVYQKIENIIQNLYHYLEKRNI